jgi:hypothetical protein
MLAVCADGDGAPEGYDVGYSMGPIQLMILVEKDSEVSVLRNLGNAENRNGRLEARAVSSFVRESTTCKVRCMVLI